MPSALTKALTAAGGKPAGKQNEVKAEPPAPAERPAAVDAAASPDPARARQPSRRDTAAITVHYPEPVRRQLKVLASEQGRHVDDMVAEALNLLFVRYHKPEIAPRKASK